MNLSKKAIAFALSAACAFTAVTAVGSNAEAAKVNYVKDGVAKIALPDEPDSMDTSKMVYTHSFMLAAHVNEGLTRKGQNDKIIAGMATKWTHSKDYKTWTFDLRKNAKWSNGTEVTANDFVFAWRRIVDPKTGANYASQLYYVKNGKTINSGKANPTTLGVKAQGKYKLVVTLEKPVTFFDDMTTMAMFYPISEAFYNKNVKNYAKSEKYLLYNGPFKLTEWKHGNKMVLKKSASYWNAANIKLGTIDCTILKDSNTTLQMFMAKQLDMAGIKGTQRATIKAAGYKIQNYNDLSSWYLEFNGKDSVFKNASIRKAFSYGIDRAGFVKNVVKNDSKVAEGFVPFGMPGLKADFRKEVGDLIQDKVSKSKAKSLLAKGLKELGLKALPKVSFLTDDSDIGREDATALQGMWKKYLGIDVDIDVADADTKNTKLTKGDFQMSFSGWGPDYNDPMTFLDMFETGNGNNHTAYSNKAYDKLILDAKNSIDPKLRMQKMAQCEKILAEDMPIATIYYRVRDYVTQSRLKGVIRRGMSPDPDLYYAYVTSK